jgi:hypothetical protein
MPAQSDILSASLIHLQVKGAVTGFQINQCRRESILFHGDLQFNHLLGGIIDLSQE